MAEELKPVLVAGFADSFERPLEEVHVNLPIEGCKRIVDSKGIGKTLVRYGAQD
ncbi:hypothetical protein MCOR02_009029 [Pyricularia oryzae]|nr:hypothetical protein MCOR02_009029 [Pyricularia oryzae]KAI6309173.1 hypothetical protein MCOR34_006963 [Pyricularia oryzae]KAI6456372.1 hypothetical protein MCOR17_008267 [Pyricularia oryzae]KAI6505942.1 hypothetical protein MCOR13_003784 [Pyricularia oryzae]KAI6567225.1 hypothetical protein MCOR04_008647 [Pyricularia oryzae]